MLTILGKRVHREGENTCQVATHRRRDFSTNERQCEEEALMVSSFVKQSIDLLLQKGVFREQDPRVQEFQGSLIELTEGLLKKKEGIRKKESLVPNPPKDTVLSYCNQENVDKLQKELEKARENLEERNLQLENLIREFEKTQNNLVEAQQIILLQKETNESLSKKNDKDLEKISGISKDSWEIENKQIQKFAHFIPEMFDNMKVLQERFKEDREILENWVQNNRNLYNNTKK